MTMIASILVVEDDPGMSIGLQDNLEFEGYRVTTAASCRDARAALQRASCDLILLDRMLPDGDSTDLCVALRRQGYHGAIIMLTAKGEEIDRVVGLESGADDYVVKPFSLCELLARIHANLRRGRRLDVQDGWVWIGVTQVNFSEHRLRRDDIELAISARELDLLRYLFRHAGVVVSREQLLKEVWDKPDDVVTRTIDNFIVRLRRKIEPDPARPVCLLTIHGFGYKLILR
jgi:DNA-binding response OmpR family regulator